MRLLFDIFSILMSFELKLKVKGEYIRMYGYNAGPHMAIPLHNTTVLCDGRYSDWSTKSSYSKQQKRIRDK